MERSVGIQAAADAVIRSTGTHKNHALGLPRGAGSQFMWKAAFDRAMTIEDLTEIIKAVMVKAKEGDIPAAKLLFDRCLGKVPDVSFSMNFKEEAQSGSVEEAKQKFWQLMSQYGMGPKSEQKVLDGEVKPVDGAKPLPAPARGLFKMRSPNG